jgi:hypothetical protein
LAERRARGKMTYQRALEMNSEGRSGAKLAVVEIAEAAEALVVETVKLLSRGCPPENLAEAAREDLLELKPHLQVALEALEDAGQHRNLTDKELAQHHAFKTLLAWAG